MNDMASRKRSTMICMCTNNRAEANDGVFVANPDEKVTVRDLEKKGLVTVRRTDEKCAGYSVWYVSLAS